MLLAALDRCEKVLSVIELIVTRITSVSMIVIMFLIFIDVFGRYLFSSPIGWLYDLTALYFINMVLYLFASETFRIRGHIALEIDLGVWARRLFWSLELIAWILVIATLITAAYVVGVSAYESFGIGEVIPGEYNWRIWIAKAIVATGLALLALRVVIETIRAVVKCGAFYGREE